jgi:YtfJ family uncharacterized protein
MRSICLPILTLATTAGLLCSSASFAAKNVDRLDSVMDEQRATSIELGQSLPFLDIQMRGEITVNGNAIVTNPWDSKNFDSKGRVQVVQYVAANRTAARQNKAFIDILIEKQFSPEELDRTVIIHMADIMAFAKGIVVKRIARKKAEQELINFVVDDKGLGLHRWGMKHKSYAIIVLDASGKVLYAKDGPLSEAEIESTIELIEKQIS